jgi:hypothetical protein
LNDRRTILKQGLAAAALAGIDHDKPREVGLRSAASRFPFERWGSGLSIACAVHCLATPLLLSLLPLTLARTLLSESVEGALLAGSVLLNGASVCRGLRVHRHWWILALLAAACGAIAAGRLAVREAFEGVFVVGGALSLAASNLLSHRLCRSCASCRASLTCNQEEEG